MSRSEWAGGETERVRGDDLGDPARRGGDRDAVRLTSSWGKREETGDPGWMFRLGRSGELDVRARVCGDGDDRRQAPLPRGRAAGRDGDSGDVGVTGETGMTGVAGEVDDADETLT